MPLLTKCPHCSKAAQIPDDQAGRPVRCPHCRQIFAVQVAPAREPAVVGSATTAAPPPRTQPELPERRAAPRPSSSSAVRLPPLTNCPSCKAKLAPGATMCLECGWMRSTDLEVGDGEGQALICTNPACGVANPLTERYCQRCNTLLPTAPGTVLHGKYQVERLLAEGGFGKVYLAKDVKANRLVAIKDMICEDAQEFELRLNFFQREAEILRLLSQFPIVPRVYDFIQHEKTAHLVMEYIPGENLLKLIEAKNNQPFALDLVVEWGRQICEVLHHLHSQTPPIIHRDLKPDNIMLLADGKTIKMIDFGTARDVGKSLKTRLAAKTRVYTEGYAPPEQIIGKPEARSDLFALAGTLYHLATGKAPEGYYTARELADQLHHSNGSIAAERRWFLELLQINLAEDANDRYFSALEIKKDLEGRRLTTEIACPACRHINKVREPYCSKCAQPLTALTPPCSRCGQPNRMGSRCCIYCGNRLR
jgi:predicted Zn finger-like uncharacterized protein